MKKHNSYKGMSLGSIAAARKRPGSSNAYRYNKDNIFAGRSGGANPKSFPLTKGGSKTLDPQRVRSAIKLAHNAPNPTALKKFVAKTAINKGNKAMKTLGMNILDTIAKKKKSTYGGNKGDISRSAPKDYKNFKDTDPNYKSKAFGGAHGDERRSAPRDYDKPKRRKRRAV